MTGRECGARCSAEVKAGTEPGHNHYEESMVTRGPLSTISA
jgi:hypothetical protein